MKNSSMEAFGMIIIAALFLMAGIIIGVTTADGVWKRDAIKANVAEYKTNREGDPVFAWKTNQVLEVK